jgi:methionyl-tRNA formyltransferase
MRIVFMGTPEFAVATLEKLHTNNFSPVAIVTQPDRPGGRGLKLRPSPVKSFSLEHGIPVMQPESVRSPEFARQVAEVNPDLIVVVAFSILPPEVFTIPKRGAINLHASLLPAFRGAAPFQRALMAGAAETGVTTFFLKEKVDTGDMIVQRKIPIGPNETAGQLHDRLMILGADVVLETVRMIDSGSVTVTPQDDRLASPAPKIKKSDWPVDWSRSAADVHNHVRGLSPYPAARARLRGTELKVFETRRVTGRGEQGEVLRADTELIIACGRDAVSILEIQRAGKGRMKAAAFLRGFEVAVGDRME